jgi:hypothetical protein
MPPAGYCAWPVCAPTVMDLFTDEKPVDFYENRQNHFGLVLSVY